MIVLTTDRQEVEKLRNLGFVEVNRLDTKNVRFLSGKRFNLILTDESFVDLIDLDFISPSIGATNSSNTGVRFDVSDFFFFFLQAVRTAL